MACVLLLWIIINVAIKIIIIPKPPSRLKILGSEGKVVRVGDLRGANASARRKCPRVFDVKSFALKEDPTTVCSRGFRKENYCRSNTPALVASGRIELVFVCVRAYVVCSSPSRQRCVIG